MLIILSLSAVTICEPAVRCDETTSGFAADSVAALAAAMRETAAQVQ
ncbi:hypothetical protein GCM10009740_05800 [Terrabacter terrae]|uniref:Uncharacterized protein n=1 Tax=Terrabacter terrae TaxID=318434 RepID=A0ABP5F8H7_9MICO